MSSMVSIHFSCMGREPRLEIQVPRPRLEPNAAARCPNFLRFALLIAALILTGCGPGLVFDDSPQMTAAEMLQRADHAFIGVIESHDFEAWPFFRVQGDNSPYWRVARRKVRVENVLFGAEERKEIEIYEIFW